MGSMLPYIAYMDPMGFNPVSRQNLAAQEFGEKWERVFFQQW